MILKVRGVKEYLKDLSSSTDEELEEKFFMAPDGWTILFRENRDKVFRMMQFNPDFLLIRRDGEVPYAYYPKYRSSIEIQILDRVPEFSTTGEVFYGAPSNFLESEVKEHSDFQRDNFNGALVFYQNMGGLREFENGYKTQANAAKSIIRTFMAQDVPFCAPFRNITYFPKIPDLPLELNVRNAFGRVNKEPVREYSF